jgi:hypothetical protein
MGRAQHLLLLLVFLVLLPTIAGAFQSPGPAADYTSLAKLFGSHGSDQNGIYKISFPRRDLRVHIGDVLVQPALGLGSWAAFREQGSKAVVDGDLVVTAAELAPVLSALIANHLEITAVHNHLVGEDPQVMYVHFFGQGATADLGRALQEVLAKTATPTGPVPPATSTVFPEDVQKQLESALKATGKSNGPVLAFSFPGKHDISMHGTGLPPAMGMATAINFQSTPAGVATTGDFVLLEQQVNPVIAILRNGDIQVTAVHNHLLDDSPRMVFVHFWANGNPDSIASTLRKALDSAQ